MASPLLSQLNIRHTNQSRLSPDNAEDAYRPTALAHDDDTSLAQWTIFQIV